MQHGMLMHAIMKFGMRRGDREVGTQKILQIIVDADFVNLALLIFKRAKHVILTVQGQWMWNVTFIMSRIVRKPDFCLCENKGADQLRSNCEADQRLCFRHSDSTIPLLLKSEISSC